MNLYAPKTIQLKNGNYLHFWYANNKGRGSDNCTIVKSSDENRAIFSKLQQDAIEMTRTSSWKGKVNFSSYVQKELNINENDLIIS